MRSEPVVEAHSVQLVQSGLHQENAIDGLLQVVRSARAQDAKGVEVLRRRELVVLYVQPLESVDGRRWKSQHELLEAQRNGRRAILRVVVDVAAERLTA